MNSESEQEDYEYAYSEEEVTDDEEMDWKDTRGADDNPNAAPMIFKSTSRAPRASNCGTPCSFVYSLASGNN
jgi:hypothetical protein